MEDVAKEIDLLRRLEHPNIVGLIGVRYDVEECVVLVGMELCSGGNLVDWRRQFKPTERIVSHYTRQMLLGLEFLHAHGVIHRDLKGRNVLIASKPEGTVLKLAGSLSLSFSFLIVYVSFRYSSPFVECSRYFFLLFLKRLLAWNLGGAIVSKCCRSGVDDEDFGCSKIIEQATKTGNAVSSNTIGAGTIGFMAPEQVVSVYLCDRIRFSYHLFLNYTDLDSGFVMFLSMTLFRFRFRFAYLCLCL